MKCDSLFRVSSMPRRIQQCFIAFILTLLASCGGAGGGSGGDEGASDNGSSGSSTREDAPLTANTVTLKDSNFQAANQRIETQLDFSALNVTSQSPEDCTVIADNYITTGTCLYPVDAVGNALSVHLHKTNTAVPGGTRLLGVDEYSSAQGAIIEGTQFDLFSPVELSTNNTLRTQYSAQELYDAISIDATYYHIQFPLSFNNENTTQWVTMHLAMYGQPFSESAAVVNAIQNCGLSESDTSQSRFTAVDQLAGMTFNRGDYLFCVKNSKDEACTADDFQWLDTATNTLTATRPGNPKQSHWLANSPIECSGGNSSGGNNSAVNFNFGPFGLFAEINDASLFQLWSDFSHQEFSNQWSNFNYPLGDASRVADPEIAWIEPYYIYYLKSCASGICENSTTEGSTLDVTFDFETGQMIFIDGLTEVEVLAETEIGELLANIHTRTQWGFDQKSMEDIVGYDVVDLSSMSVTANISVSGGTSAPANAIVYCQDLDPANADEDGCGEAGQ